MKPQTRRHQDAIAKRNANRERKLAKLCEVLEEALSFRNYDEAFHAARKVRNAMAERDDRHPILGVLDQLADMVSDLDCEEEA